MVKSVADLNRDEPCPDCKSPDTFREINGFSFYGASDWDSAEFNHGLGRVTRNAKHRGEIAKRLGVEEIGNQDPDRMHKHYESQRDADREASWGKV